MSIWSQLVLIFLTVFLYVLWIFYISPEIIESLNYGGAGGNIFVFLSNSALIIPFIFPFMAVLWILIALKTTLRKWWNFITTRKCLSYRWLMVSQNGWGWKAPLEAVQSNSRLQAGSPGADYSRLCLDSFCISPQPLYIAVLHENIIAIWKIIEVIPAGHNQKYFFN